MDNAKKMNSMTCLHSERTLDIQYEELVQGNINSQYTI